MVIMDEGSSPRKLHWCEVSVEQDLFNEIKLIPQKLVVGRWSNIKGTDSSVCGSGIVIRKRIKNW